MNTDETKHYTASQGAWRWSGGRAQTRASGRGTGQQRSLPGRRDPRVSFPWFWVLLFVRFRTPRLHRHVSFHPGAVWGNGRAAAQVQQRRDTSVHAAPWELPAPALSPTRPCLPVSVGDGGRVPHHASHLPAPCSGGSVPLGRLRPEARGRRNRVASPDVGGPG